MDPIVNNLAGLALIGGTVLMFSPTEEPASAPKKPYAALVDLGYQTAQETLVDALPDPKDYPRASLTCNLIGDRLKVRGQVNSYFDGCHSQMWDVYFAQDQSGNWIVDQVDLNGSEIGK